MNEKVKKAFEQIRAEEELKSATREYLRQRIQQSSKEKSRLLKRILPAAVCFLFVLLGAGGYHLYFTPVSVISIDINPSVEWSLNRFHRVIYVESYNEDGKELSQALDVTHKSYTEALMLLIENPLMEEYLAQDEYLSVTVAGEDDADSQQILRTVRECTAQIQNAYCATADYSQLEAAHKAGLSCGKYQYYQILQSMDEDITPEEIRQMTMREIRELIDLLTEDGSGDTGITDLPSQGNHGQGANNGSSEQGNHGQGQGANNGSSEQGNHGQGQEANNGSLQQGKGQYGKMG